MRRLKNRYGASPVPRGKAGARPAREGEDALALEKEVALLGKEQVEPRQVDLLLVLFDLREIGVVREVGGQALGDAVLHVDADVAGRRRCERAGAACGRS